MILVVEGPSAAGKTSYCRTFEEPAVVPETPGGTVPPVGASPSAAGRFWTERNADRWSQACRAEAATGLAVCDTDPLKLHFAWCLARAGLASPAAFLAQLGCAREVMAEHRLGMADLIVCQLSPLAELRRRRAGDPTRSRRNFETNARLAEPLREWYEALDAVDPGRVAWQWPAEAPGPAVRERYDLGLFDAWMRTLPALGSL
ncbi:hypothetical protein [Kitasatospora sp. NBC_01266]|uniref:hypothetical protein n=1 Tax=Kitasatospora sp. NBC_01266 TaxID=2903572 RepID=UPI002E314620|nr:hypothetical protein [Kitasatospora sp. NBC_01266]